MQLHAALAATATLVSTAFALCTLERWLDRRKPQEMAWTVALALFALGSLALFAGAAIGWTEWTFKPFYLFGAILNVPVLALGTVYLLAPRRAADRTSLVIALLCAFASGIVLASPLTHPIDDPAALPAGKEVFGAGPRILAAVGSGLPSLVIVGGALWSAARLLGARRRHRASANIALVPGALPPGRLAAANVLIALGTIVTGAAGLFNSVLDEMDAFAVALVVGIAVIFVGFLLTSSAPRRRAAATAPVAPWYPHSAGTAHPEPGASRQAQAHQTPSSPSSTPLRRHG